MAENAFRKNLTPRTLQIMELVSEGHTSREISEILKISPRTVEVHKANAFKILGVTKSIEAVMIFTKMKNFKSGFRSCAEMISNFINDNFLKDGINSDMNEVNLFIDRIVRIGDFYNFDNNESHFNFNDIAINSRVKDCDIVDSIVEFIFHSEKNRVEISDYISAKLSVSSESVLDLLDDFSDAKRPDALWRRTRKGRKGYVYSLVGDCQ